MSVVLRRSYLKARNNVLSSSHTTNTPLSSYLVGLLSRNFSEDKTNSPDFINSTILIENGLNVHELPVIVRKLKDLSEIDQKSSSGEVKNTNDSVKYHLIQAEFKQCVDLRDVFSLLSKCTKITPNIALGAMERIYDIERSPNALSIDYNMQVSTAKGAILDKLLSIVTKTEDTQTILNILNTSSSFMDPYKYKFCDELLLRVVDNRLSLEQLCEFITFLIRNKSDPRYFETIDKLWVGFVDRENEIDETNIVEVFRVLPGFKVSKRTILALLEQKLFDLWGKITTPVMQEVLNTFVEEKYSSLQSFGVVGKWMLTNIHALDEDSFLDMITKLTRLNYTDDNIDKATEKYMKLKGSRIQSHIVIVGMLNYCMQFKICNPNVLNVCSEFFLQNSDDIPPSFIKPFVYPFGYLNFIPTDSTKLWKHIEKVLIEKFERISADDLSSIVLSLIYVGSYPLQLVNKMFSAEYLANISDAKVMNKMHLIDTALSLECGDYSGPLLPKDQWSKPIAQDRRIYNLLDKTKDAFISVAGGEDKLSIGVLIPNMYSDETYQIDVMIHPTDLGSNTFNWKVKSAKNENVAILIHLPDHYCSDNEKLIGPQSMKIKHLRLLGMRVASLKYSTISQFYTSFNSSGLRKYILDSIDNAQPCL